MRPGGAGRARRLALLAIAALVLASCHTTHRGHYARGPVPTALVPFEEPLRYSVGPEAGELVPAGRGLLATYMRGAMYDFVDHQQVDPNVDFHASRTRGSRDSSSTVRLSSARGASPARGAAEDTCTIVRSGRSPRRPTSSCWRPALIARSDTSIAVPSATPSVASP